MSRANARTGRSAASRMVTCLEAIEQGYTFVTTCSKCDYYLQNKNLNMKAMTRPRSELSKMWQCSSLHKLGDLFHSHCNSTPYQPVKLDKNNSYICIDRSSSGIRSGEKRVRLFTPSPNSNEDNEGIKASGFPSVEAVRKETSMLASLNKALAEIDMLVKERDRLLNQCQVTIEERDQAIKERDLALEERDRAFRQIEMVRSDHYRAIIDRDVAFEKFNAAAKERDAAAQASANALEERDAALIARDDAMKLGEDAVQKLTKALADKNNSELMLQKCSGSVQALSSRVEHLERTYNEKRTIVLSNQSANGNNWSHLNNVSKFCKKIYPQLNVKDGTKQLFDLLYSSRKSFKLHVNKRMKEALYPQLRMKICREIKQQFAPWRFLEVLDCSKQSLNQECYKALYSVQKSLPKWAKVLPEVKHIQRAQYRLNNHLNNLIPMQLEPERESGKFSYWEYTDYLLQQFGLSDLINNPNLDRPVIVAVTFDGGSLSRFLGHVTGGYKLVDPRTRNPKTGELLFGDSGTVKVQSHIHCFPIKVAFAKDSKELYRTEFADFFRFLKDYERHHHHRIKFVFPQDMSSIWKTTGRGGTAKVKSFPCYCCAVTSDTLVTPQPKDKCFRGHRCVQPRCYHHPMLSQEAMEAWLEQKTQLEGEYPYLLNPSRELKKSQIFLSSIDALRDECNPYDIAFCPSNLEEGQQFDRLLTTELGYRGLPSQGTIADKRSRLLAALEAETAHQLIKKLIESKDEASAFCEVEDAIPCIMHGSNRTGEKLFMLLLLEAWSNCESKQQKEALIAAVEVYVNTGVFGTAQSASQWKVPVNDDSDLDQVSFTAWRVRKIMEKLSDLAPIILAQQTNDRVVKWRDMLNKYNNMMQVAFQHDDFNDDDVELFQDMIDEWFYHYVELVGLPGITNYVHLLGAGHLYFYLKKWGSLYRYQQQGWEMKNGIIASFYNRRTRKGGAGGRFGPSHTSRIVPVLQWFQRTTAWTTGCASAFFMANERN